MGSRFEELTVSDLHENRGPGAFPTRLAVEGRAGKRQLTALLLVAGIRMVSKATFARNLAE